MGYKVDDITPAYGGFSITPHDTNNLAVPIRGLYVGVSGNVKVIMQSGETVTFVGLAAGIVHPICATRVFDTDTTATSIVGLT